MLHLDFKTYIQECIFYQKLQQIYKIFFFFSPNHPELNFLLGIAFGEHFLAVTFSFTDPLSTLFKFNFPKSNIT
jgi:hypothetical protein